MPAPVPVEPFSIAVDVDTLDDLRARIRRTRWPEPAPDEAWRQGTELGYLQGLLADWADGFDWAARERELNSHPQFRAHVDGVWIHFVHQRARGGHGLPLILTHGWPSLFTEYLPVVPLLTDPAAHGIDGPSFDLIIPSLPGYGYSERPRRTGVNYRYVADLWHRLMVSLGYDRYAAGGGDFGAGVATFMALDRPEALIGLHLSNLELTPYLGPGSRPLSGVERVYIEHSEAWWRSEGGYKAIQSTKPQTIGYALNDSPAGLAAWICEKWRSWTDSDGDLDARVSREFLLTLLTLFWVTGSITSSMRDYFDNRWHGILMRAADVVRVPTAIASFSRQFAPEGDPPREYAERLYDVHRWTQMARGGHFAPVEEPELLAADIAAFFADCTARGRSGSWR